jgi:hypothetical protein
MANSIPDAERRVLVAAKEWEKAPTIANGDNLTQALRHLRTIERVRELTR